MSREPSKLSREIFLPGMWFVCFLMLLIFIESNADTPQTPTSAVLRYLGPIRRVPEIHRVTPYPLRNSDPTEGPYDFSRGELLFASHTYIYAPGENNGVLLKCFRHGNRSPSTVQSLPNEIRTELESHNDLDFAFYVAGEYSVNFAFGLIELNQEERKLLIEKIEEYQAARPHAEFLPVKLSGVCAKHIDWRPAKDLFDIFKDSEEENRQEILSKIAPQVTLQVARGLAFLHKYDFVHGDIKLENIMWDPKKLQAYIIDIDYLGAPLSHYDQNFIPPGYRGMSPGSIKGNDIYALGISISEMLYGESPFDADFIRLLSAGIPEIEGHRYAYAVDYAHAGFWLSRNMLKLPELRFIKHVAMICTGMEGKYNFTADTMVGILREGNVDTLIRNIANIYGVERRQEPSQSFRISPGEMDALECQFIAEDIFEDRASGFLMLETMTVMQSVLRADSSENQKLPSEAREAGKWIASFLDVFTTFIHRDGLEPMATPTPTSEPNDQNPNGAETGETNGSLIFRLVRECKGKCGLPTYPDLSGGKPQDISTALQELVRRAWDTERWVESPGKEMRDILTETIDTIVLAF